jgi:hypothetical protein
MLDHRLNAFRRERKEERREEREERLKTLRWGFAWDAQVILDQIAQHVKCVGPVPRTLNTPRLHQSGHVSHVESCVFLEHRGAGSLRGVSTQVRAGL